MEIPPQRQTHEDQELPHGRHSYPEQYQVISCVIRTKPGMIRSGEILKKNLVGWGVDGGSINEDD